MILSGIIIHHPPTITITTAETITTIIINLTTTAATTTGIATTTHAVLYGGVQSFIQLVPVSPGGMTISRFPSHPTTLYVTTTALPITTAGTTVEAAIHLFITEVGAAAGTEGSHTSATPGRSTAPIISTNLNRSS